MLKPEYLQSVPDNMIKLFAQAEADILADMARRISEYDYWIPAAEHQAKMLEEAGMVREEILARLNRLTGKTTKELTELMVEAGTVALKSDDEVYQRSGLDPPPISSSRDLQAVLQAGYEKTAGQFLNLTKTTANTATFQFERALDRAYMQITMGGFDYNTAIRNTIKDLSKDGVGAIRYPSGKVDSIEVAVRRAVVTGVNQTSLRLQDTRADEMGSDLVEVSAHAGARPEHAVWQGGIYSRSGKSTKYPGLVETTGYGTGAGLGGWNCSHSYRPWFEGMPRTYSEDMLEEYNAKNIEYDGKKLTEYEALQEQRYIERNIRRWKREEAAMSAAGLDASEATAKVREWNRKHRYFLEQTGLKADGTRVIVGVHSAQRQKEIAIRAELKELGFRGKMNIIPKQINVDMLGFDDKHINGEREHNVTADEAKGFVRNAKISMTVWNGKFERYYSEDGASYVDTTSHQIRTAFKKDQYDEKTRKLLEVLKKYE